MTWNSGAALFKNDSGYTVELHIEAYRQYAIPVSGKVIQAGVLPNIQESYQRYPPALVTCTSAGAIHEDALAAHNNALSTMTAGLATQQSSLAGVHKAITDLHSRDESKAGPPSGIHATNHHTADEVQNVIAGVGAAQFMYHNRQSVLRGLNSGARALSEGASVARGAIRSAADHASFFSNAWKAIKSGWRAAAPVVEEATEMAAFAL